MLNAMLTLAIAFGFTPQVTEMTQYYDADKQTIVQIVPYIEVLLYDRSGKIAFQIEVR